jgi:predicted GIY-YIG superfamily endonuclease
MWYVYFLRLADGSVYVGSTNDLRHRYDSHQRGQVISTKRHLPVALESYVAVPTERHARQLERYFKSGSGKAFAKKRLCPSDNPQNP